MPYRPRGGGRIEVPMARKPTVLRARSRLAELKALRWILAERIDDEKTSARDLAALIRQLREVSVEIEDLSAVASDEKAGVLIDTSDASWQLHSI